ncbi:TIGR04255 family protein [Rhizobium phaseoli]|nr:TIGR04255 family protein [Rhizobium phaseoli]
MRFPLIPDVDSFAGIVQSALGKEFRHRRNEKLAQLNLRIEEKGVELVQEEVSLWQFLSEDGHWGVLVNRGMIGLHTNAYVDHKNFLDRFISVIERVVAAAGESIQQVEALALRYLDLVKPGADDTLEDYFQPGVLPASVDFGGLSMLGGIQIVNLKSELGPLKLQVIRKPDTVFPVDLHSPLVIGNDWSLKTPEDVDFATIDTDHAMIFSPPAELETFDYRTKLFSLREPIGGIFTRITTEHAHEVWKKA